jgi:hypothetical protein
MIPNFENNVPKFQVLIVNSVFPNTEVPEVQGSYE